MRYRRRMRVRDVGIAVLLGAIGSAGCILINSFDEVKAHLADSGPPAESGVPDSVVHNDADAIATETTPPPVDADVGPDAPLVEDHGLLVVGGEIAAGSARQQKLFVIDPLDGSELSREDMTVSAVVFDGKGDRWYIFQNAAPTHVQPVPGDKITLHVRTWNLQGRKWDPDLKTIDVPTLVEHGVMAMLNGEIAYVAYTDTGSLGLTLLNANASDPSKIGLIGSKPTYDLPVTSGILALLGTPNGSSTGGWVSLLHKGTCTGSGDTACPLETYRVQVPNSFVDPVVATTPKPAAAIPNSTSLTPGWGVRLSPAEHLVAIPHTDTDPNGTIVRIEPTTGDTIGSLKWSMAASATKQLKPMASSECNGGTIFAIELISEQIYAIPVSDPAHAINQKSDNPGQFLVWEPYTRTVIAPYSQGTGKELLAYQMKVDAATKKPVSLVKRTGASWKVPDDLFPNIVGVKQLNSDPCPGPDVTP